MKKIVISCLFLICCYFPFSDREPFQIIGKTSRRESRKLIGKIKDLSVLNDCGCEFPDQKNPQEFIFVTNDLSRKGWINFDGNDVELNKLAEFSKEEGLKVGKKFSSRFEAEGIKVLVVYTFTGFCTSDPECGLTYWKASITVAKGTRKQTIKINGSCRCT
jgi:hypothetical protein